jgi:putative PIN family toxin of toxin-antitoxin system
MPAVVDVNILVRALIKPDGTVGPVLRRLRDGAFTLLYSEAILDELLDVLSRPRIRAKYQLEDDDIETVLLLVLLRGEPVVPGRRVMSCRDPLDDKFLEVAVAGKADVIVSGDQDLLVLSPFEGIAIVGPATFLAMLESDAIGGHLP